jgi:GntR family transcriptional regulator / MocR family aminotransferase
MSAAASLSLSLDVDSSQSCYRQIECQLRQLIDHGRLKAGDKLPSSRELAQSLGVSRTSTLSAYNQLIAEGFVISKARKGLFVASNLPVLQSQCLSSNLEQPVAVHAQSSPDSFDSGADVSRFPQRQWANCMKRSWLRPDPDLLNGSYISGLPELKQQVAEYLRQLRGLDCHPQQIVITAGNRDALTILSQALSASAGNIWLENPCYRPMHGLLSMLHRSPLPLSIDEQGALMPQTDSCSGMVILTPNRQYPLGMVMSPQRRAQWLSWQQHCLAAGHSLWLVEDDYDNEFIYQGRSHVPLMQLDRQQRTFFVGSFSKALFRGLRLGFIVAPLDQAERLIQAQQVLGNSAALTSQPALAEFIHSGEFARHLRRMRRHYLSNRNLLLEAIEPLSPWLDWQKPQGGMHLLAKLKPQWQCTDSIGYVDQRIAQLALKKGLKLNTLSEHYFAPQAHQGFILGFSQLQQDKLQDQIRILADTLQQILNY